ncbi:hypothetical protein F5Y01DRAFT_105838 [Xylaria sp. FL0043]|nr:hypothetical protein F5Y01DRAFT_105838 [Xylaria sp. FL0043]
MENGEWRHVMDHEMIGKQPSITLDDYNTITTPERPLHNSSHPGPTALGEACMTCKHKNRWHKLTRKKEFRCGIHRRTRGDDETPRAANPCEMPCRATGIFGVLLDRIIEAARILFKTCCPRRFRRWLLTSYNYRPFARATTHLLLSCKVKSSVGSSSRQRLLSNGKPIQQDRNARARTASPRPPYHPLAYCLFYLPEATTQGPRRITRQPIVSGKKCRTTLEGRSSSDILRRREYETTSVVRRLRKGTPHLKTRINHDTCQRCTPPERLLGQNRIVFQEYSKCFHR